MEALQRRAARIVMRTTDSDSAMDNLKWPTLEYRRSKRILNLVEKFGIYMFKLLHGKIV